jgi:hypothetical protein
MRVSERRYSSSTAHSLLTGNWPLLIICCEAVMRDAGMPPRISGSLTQVTPKSRRLWGATTRSTLQSRASGFRSRPAPVGGPAILGHGINQRDVVRHRGGRVGRGRGARCGGNGRTGRRGRRGSGCDGTIRCRMPKDALEKIHGRSGLPLGPDGASVAPRAQIDGPAP